jgi:uncharacterized protein (TIGR03437 family)
VVAAADAARDGSVLFRSRICSAEKGELNMRTASIAVLALAASLSAQSVSTSPFRAILTTQSETGPLADSSARGSATIWIHVVRDASGSVVSGSADFVLSYTFSGPVSITQAHIARGRVGLAGPPVIEFPVTRDDSTGTGTLQSRQVGFTASSAPATTDAINALLTDASQFYLEVMTADSPTGALRGQLQPADQVVLMSQLSPANEVPAILGANASATATILALRTTDSSGNPTSGYVAFDLTYSGAPTDTTFTALRLQFGPPGANGAATIDSGLKSAFGGATGVLHFEAEVDLTVPSAGDTLQALFSANPGSSVYINATTVTNPTGALRGALRRTSHAALQTTLSSDQVMVSPPLGINANAPSVIHVYTLRNPDGSIPAGAVLFDVNPTLPSGTSLAALHIHDGLARQNGPLAIDARLSAAPLLVTDGTGNIFRLVTVTSDAGIATLNSLVQNPEKHYIDLHTNAFPNGIARAQVQPPNIQVPFVAFVLNPADDHRTTAAAGGLMNIFGDNLVKVPANLDGFPPLDVLPRSLDGTSVTIAGLPAPLASADLHILLVQVPNEVATGDQDVVVANSNGASATFKLHVQPLAPAIFHDSTGGLIFKTDSTLIRPQQPAAAGDVLVMFGIGLGQTTDPLNTARVVPSGPPFFSTLPVTVTIGTQTAPAVYSIAAPGYTGLFQVAFVMPSGIAPGAAPLSISLNGESSNVVTIAVK